jgi:hypothetical protein
MAMAVLAASDLSLTQAAKIDIPLTEYFPFRALTSGRIPHSYSYLVPRLAARYPDVPRHRFMSDVDALSRLPRDDVLPRSVRDIAIRAAANGHQ